MPMILLSALDVYKRQTGSSSAHASVVQTINSNDISQSINLLTRYSVLLEKIKSAKYDGTGFDFGKLNLSELEKYASLLKSALSNGEISRDELNKFKIDIISAEGAVSYTHLQNSS